MMSEAPQTPLLSGAMATAYLPHPIKCVLFGNEVMANVTKCAANSEPPCCSISNEDSFEKMLA
jgi:hypothetical protein